MKSLFALSMRNLRHHARSHLAVLGGVAVGAAVLCGALFVGDSLRGSLKSRAERQVNGITAAYLGEKLLDSRLAAKLDGDVIPALMLKGTATVESDSTDLTGTARVTIIGLDAAGLSKFDLPLIAEGTAVASLQLAAKLGAKANDKLRVSVQQYSSVPRSSLLGKRDADDLTTAFTVKLASITSDTNPANDFALVPSTDTPLNLYVPMAFLQKRVKQEHKANALLAFTGDAKTFNDKLASVLTPADWGLRIQLAPSRKSYVSVESEQLILPPAVVDATLAAAKELNARAEPTTVYLANWIAANAKKRVPYSVVAAVDVNATAPLGPFVPNNVTLKDDEIILTDWPESPLKDVAIGSTISLDFFEPEVETRVTETSTKFTLAGRIPLDGVAKDPDLSPPFPGITDKLRIGDWNPPFPFESNRIKPGDANEKYWDKYKTTPKAYITRAAGEKLFKSRFGVTTSVRVAGTTPQDLTNALQKSLTPQQLGIQFEDTQAMLAKASVGGTDFGGLFLGFSLFLIVAALVLVGLLLRLSVERRAKEIGTFLALGFTPKQIRNGLLTEIFFVALIGAAIGLGVAVLYTRGLLMVLADLWPDAGVKLFLTPHYRTRSAYYGSFGALEMSLLASWLAVRGLVKLPAPMLLRGRTEIVESAITEKPRRKWMGLAIIFTLLLGLGSLAAGIPQKNPDFRAMSFFGGGSLVFLAGLLAIRRWLRSDSAPMPKSLGTLGRRNAGRFLGRSTLTVFLIGSATFLLVAVESFRRKPSADFGDKDGGSGGFNLLAEADVPLFHPFNVDPGRGDFMDSLDKEWQRKPGSDTLEMKRLNANKLLDRIETVIPLRRRSGDDASCLNLYQAGKPRLLGVPKELIDRGGFRFAETEAVTSEEKANPWLLLTKAREDGAIPVFGEMNSVMWMLKKAVGDEIELPDENGVNKKFRIVGTLQDSPFQSELLLSDGPFRQLYPHDEGYAEFLIATRGDEASVAKLLETGLQSQGMLVTATKDRVASYQAVISTYLTTFQLLGGLGLLLGVLGLAAVVLRGVWERQSEFALLRAVGYTPGNVRTIVLAENLFLLALGVGLGLVAAGVSVAPHVLLSGQWPWKGVVALLVLVGVVGTAVVFLATARATRISILDGLRSE